MRAVRWLRVGQRAALSGVLLFAGGLNALDPAHDIIQYAHAALTRQNSRMPGSVFSLAQTPDGTLWVGTEFGLWRFDGARFLRPGGSSDNRLAGEYINALASARDGTLWIGTRDSLIRWKGDVAHVYDTKKAAGTAGVSSILIDHGGTVWAGVAGYRSGGLCHVENDRLRCYGADDGLQGFDVFSLWEDHSRALWVGGFGLSRWKPSEVQLSQVYDPLAMIYSVAEDGKGEIWVSTSSQPGLKHFVGGKLVSFPLGSLAEKIQPMTLLCDRDGALWIGTMGQGLFHLHQGRVDRFAHADGLSSDFVRHVFEDREGNIWVGTDGGLDRFRDLPVTTISTQQGLTEDTAGSLFASKDGSVWVGTTSGLNRVCRDRILRYSRRNGLRSDSILSIFEEQGGRVWVQTKAGLEYLVRGQFNRPADLRVRNIGLIAAAAEDSNGNVWFSDARQGLVRLRGSRVVGVVPWSQFQNLQALALEPDLNDGGLWLGFSQGGVAYYKPGHAAHWYTTGDGLGRGSVLDLHFSKDGALWIATQGGLSRLYRGRISTMTAANGLPCDHIQAMVEDDSGAMWLNTPCGLVRIAVADLGTWAADPKRRVPVSIYGADDGMWSRATDSGYFRRAVKSNDGRLWFAVFHGVAVVDPAHLYENRMAPPVQIEQIVAGRKTYAVHSNLELPPLTSELQIDYTALSFAAPDRVRFRYRLNGFDKDWRDVGAQRQAVYTNLPPRHYRFQVIACNNDGVWNNTGASLEFSVKPAFYQTNLFRLASLAGLVLLLWGFHVLRLQRLAAQMQIRFDERLAERTRIGREIHDSLLQNISGLALQLEGLSKTMGDPAKNRLRELRRQAEQCIREAREFIWDLRSPTLTQRDLLTALRQVGEETTAGERVQFNMTVSGERRPVSVQFQEQLLRIVQEAARNAVRHGSAKQINMTLDYQAPNLVCVRMCDDGRGFDLEQVSGKLGHWGLRNMRERAEQIGAELKISTAPGHGTQIEILVPVATHS